MHGMRVTSGCIGMRSIAAAIAAIAPERTCSSAHVGFFPPGAARATGLAAGGGGTAAAGAHCLFGECAWEAFEPPQKCEARASAGFASPSSASASAGWRRVMTPEPASGNSKGDGSSAATFCSPIFVTLPSRPTTDSRSSNLRRKADRGAAEELALAAILMRRKPASGAAVGTLMAHTMGTTAGSNGRSRGYNCRKSQ